MSLVYLGTLPAATGCLQVNQKLQLFAQGKYVDDSPDLGDRSPSPEPIYNESGARINTREQRAKEKLLRKRNVSSDLLIDHAESAVRQCNSASTCSSCKQLPANSEQHPAAVIICAVSQWLCRFDQSSSSMMCPSSRGSLQLAVSP